MKKVWLDQKQVPTYKHKLNIKKWPWLNIVSEKGQPLSIPNKAGQVLHGNLWVLHLWSLWLEALISMCLWASGMLLQYVSRSCSELDLQWICVYGRTYLWICLGLVCVWWELNWACCLQVGTDGPKGLMFLLNLVNTSPEHMPSAMSLPAAHQQNPNPPPQLGSPSLMYLPQRTTALLRFCFLLEPVLFEHRGVQCC